MRMFTGLLAATLVAAPLYSAQAQQPPASSIEDARAAMGIAGRDARQAAGEARDAAKMAVDAAGTAVRDASRESRR